mmetsp:Transcript_37504/g.63134  ORF Transcript_37504/g.63134 Transcript_37504/m.63134 type:complete len:80 (+) Transcript_37504:105-344(+)
MFTTPELVSLWINWRLACWMHHWSSYGHCRRHVEETYVRFISADVLSDDLLSHKHKKPDHLSYNQKPNKLSHDLLPHSH